MDNINFMINKWNDLLENEWEEILNMSDRIGELICKQISSIIPDIAYTLECVINEEDKIPVICFWAESRRIHSKKVNFNEKAISLESIIEKVFPNLSIDCPNGIYLVKKEEIKKVRNLLLKLKLEEA